MEEQFARLTLGRIVWATLPGSDGRPCEAHRFVIVVPPGSASPDAELSVVGISTRPPDKGREWYCVPMMWMDRPGGHPETKLTQRCYAHCNWIRITTISALSNLAGVVGEAKMREIRRVLDRIQAEG